MDAEMDLRHVGKVELSAEEAFRVWVTDAAGEPGRLHDTQYWRVDTLNYYTRAGKARNCLPAQKTRLNGSSSATCAAVRK